MYIDRNRFEYWNNYEEVLIELKLKKYKLKIADIDKLLLELLPDEKIDINAELMKYLPKDIVKFCIIPYLEPNIDLDRPHIIRNFLQFLLCPITCQMGIKNYIPYFNSMYYALFLSAKKKRENIKYLYKNYYLTREVLYNHYNRYNVHYTESYLYYDNPNKLVMMHNEHKTKFSY